MGTRIYVGERVLTPVLLSWHLHLLYLAASTIPATDARVMMMLLNSMIAIELL